MTLARNAFEPNEGYDREYASHGDSRYCAYLALKRGMFLFDGDDPPTRDPLEFAATAWTIAQSPIMSPGYMSVHPRIQSADATWDDERNLAITVTLALEVSPAALGVPKARGWERHRIPGRWYDPEDCAVLTALCLATVRVPIRPGDLPMPEYYGAIPVTAVAKAAVAAVCCVLNPVVSPLLAG